MKWYGKMAFDPAIGYGEVIFVDPNGQDGQTKIIDGMLRMRCQYDPTNAAKYNDPYSRTWLSTNLTSSWPDGTTSVPTMGTGYYECRMLVPIGIGTWPAFWLNDQGGLVMRNQGKNSIYGRETDILEQYNETPGHVSTQHRYQPNPNFDASKPESDTNKKTIDKPTGFNVSADLGREGWHWIRLGCLTTADTIKYYVNDVLVATDTKFNPSDRGAMDPGLEHILLSMSMGGGWPIAVPPSGYYDLYIDYVRYWQ